MGYCTGISSSCLATAPKYFYLIQGSRVLLQVEKTMLTFLLACFEAVVIVAAG